MLFDEGVQTTTGDAGTTDEPVTTPPADDSTDTTPETKDEGQEVV